MEDRHRSVKANGSLIRALRCNAGLTRAQLATCVTQRYWADRAMRSPLSVSTVKRMEKGERVYAANLRAVAEVLEVRTEELIDPAEKLESKPAQGGGTAGAAMSLRRRWERTYGRLIVRGEKLVHDKIMKPEYYWRGFWNIQGRQFRDWLDGRLDDPLYADWMTYRVREYTENRAVGGIKFRDSWRAYARSTAPANLVSFFRRVFRDKIALAMQAARATPYLSESTDQTVTSLTHHLQTSARKPPVRAAGTRTRTPSTETYPRSEAQAKRTR